MEKNRKQLDKTGEIRELSEEDLDKVSGGKEYNAGEQIDYPSSNICRYFVCKFCGNKTSTVRGANRLAHICDKCGLVACCMNCASSSQVDKNWYCTDDHKK